MIASRVQCAETAMIRMPPFGAATQVLNWPSAVFAVQWQRPDDPSCFLM